MTINSAKDIANWFIAWAEYNECQLTRLSLQKLLYFAQGYTLAQLGKPLFYDEIEAWEHGPVVREIWYSSRTPNENSDNNYTIPYIDDFDFEIVPEDETQILADVWETFGDKPAKHLENITHLEYPWKDAYGEGVKADNVITKDVLEEYYSELIYHSFINSDKGEEFIGLFEKAAA